MAKKTTVKESKEKTFNVEYCPKCKSFDVAIALGAKLGTWECKKCKYKGDFPKKEMSEEEYLEYLDKQGVEMPELGEPQTFKGVDDKSAGAEKKSYKDILRERLARGEKI